MLDNFSEVQKFRQGWLWVLILLCAAVLVLVLGYGLIEQLVFNRSWGDRPLSDTALIVVAVGSIVFVAMMVYLFASLRLMTCVDANGVYVRFYPFAGRTILFADIQSCQARSYRPLSEYGGWGIKYGRSGKAYNVSGNQGAQLILRSGKRVLIGSQYADELAATINAYLECGDTVFAE